MKIPPEIQSTLDGSTQELLLYRQPPTGKPNPMDSQQPPAAQPEGLQLHCDSFGTKLRTRSVLYLGFDGVLHHSNVGWHRKQGPHMKQPRQRLLAYADLLADLLAPVLDLEIVLSTSWVARLGFFSSARRLPRELRQRCVGSTYRVGMDQHQYGRMSRGQQIAADLNLRRPSSWLAIDDDDRGFLDRMRSRVVCTDGDLGLAAPGPVMQLRAQVAKLIELPAAPRVAAPVF